jgi:hypothetical protein
MKLTNKKLFVVVTLILSFLIAGLSVNQVSQASKKNKLEKTSTGAVVIDRGRSGKYFFKVYFSGDKQGQSFLIKRIWWIYEISAGDESNIVVYRRKGKSYDKKFETPDSLGISGAWESSWDVRNYKERLKSETRYCVRFRSDTPVLKDKESNCAWIRTP